MKTIDEKVDDAVHAALGALGISAETTPTFAEDLNDWLRERAQWVVTDDYEPLWCEQCGERRQVVRTEHAGLCAQCAAALIDNPEG